MRDFHTHMSPGSCRGRGGGWWGVVMTSNGRRKAWNLESLIGARAMGHSTFSGRLFIYIMRKIIPADSVIDNCSEK